MLNGKCATTICAGALWTLILSVFFMDCVFAAGNNVLRLTEFNVIRSNSDRFDILQQMEPVTLPDSWHERRQTPFRNSWYSTRIRLNDNQKTFAVYIPRASMNVSVSINGQEIGNGGYFTEPISRNHGRPLMFFVPSAFTGTNSSVDLTIRVADNSWAFGYIGPIYVGDTAAITSMFRAREFWQVHFTMALALLMVIFSIASFVLHMTRKQEKYYFWFGTAMLLFAVDTFNVFIVDIPVSRQIWEIYNQMVIYSFAMATIIFIHRFTGVGAKFMEPVLGLVFILKLTVLLLVDVDYLFTAGSMFNLVVIAYGFILAIFIVRSYFKKSRFETGVTALAGIVLLVVATHTWLVQLGIIDPENLHIIHYGAPCFFLLISLSLVRKFLRSLESTEALAGELDQRVRDKERELEITYKEMNILNQKKALSEERARIMREVHDGFGAHLIGALTMLETDSVNHRELSAYLKSSLLDLRIMIDSLDPNIDEVSIALGMLRTRVEPILKNRQIALDWNLYDLPDDLQLNPHKTLSLLRVLQELFTNTLKHSIANRINIKSQIDADNNERKLTIKYWENGTGFDTGSNTGRGIRNIHKRVNDLYGEIIYSNNNDGFETIITIPGFPPA